MLEEAYLELHALETQHWWFVGARIVYRTLLHLGLGPPSGRQRILEIGSGSGGNLALLSEYGPTVGVEPSWLALKLTRFRPELGLVQARAEALPFMKNCFDGVNLLGVIEHIEQDKAVLDEAVRVCRRNGALILLTSALPILWSHHDEANLHKRRYTKSGLHQLLKSARLAPLRLSYLNFFIFAPVFIVRLWQRFRSTAPKYDMSKPGRLFNNILILLLKLEAWLIQKVELPIGVDLVAVCKIREDP